MIRLTRVSLFFSVEDSVWVLTACVLIAPWTIYISMCGTINIHLILRQWWVHQTTLLHFILHAFFCWHSLKKRARGFRYIFLGGVTRQKVHVFEHRNMVEAFEVHIGDQIPPLFPGSLHCLQETGDNKL